KYLSERGVSPTIARLSQKFEAIRQRELEKAFRSLDSLEPREREIVEACTRGIVAKILHEPITGLKAAEVKKEGDSFSEALRKLFGLESDL
ncbi:MAG: glutamyl-tRNA reductase, partial [bacterium]|nr:glutamyl-tRNA reductase [bacterium]